MVLDNPPVVARILIHVSRDMLDRYGQEGFGFYAALAPGLRARGVPVEFVDRPGTTDLTHYTREDFHLVHHGFLRRFNLLNTGIAYLWPYWYLDQRGVLCDSSLGRAQPDLSHVPEDRARAFVDRVGGRLKEKGQSKHDQPPRQGALARDAIVVFLQGLSDPVLRNMAMLETEMLDLVLAHRGGRRVVIKPHPKFPATIATAHAQALADAHAAVEIVDANVHDLLEGAYCSVSICSGASFEGLFHRTPAVLFGRADFAACAWSVTTEEEAASALTGVGEVAFDYERFLYWFLQRKMFNAQHPGLVDRVIHRIARTGFDLGVSVDAPDETGAAVGGVRTGGAGTRNL
ncbi:MAG: hypothetical protein AAFZ04_05330 [Pseudomonadota bacterium]